jgi:hypothetical protein
MKAFEEKCHWNIGIPNNKLNEKKSSLINEVSI